MRYFDEQLVANHPREHGAWWAEVSGVRNWWHQQEEILCAAMNATSVLPRDAWLEMDSITRRVMRDDGGAVIMRDLMALARPINIGKLVALNRVSGDAGTVVRSMSGQVAVPVDKVDYDYRGTPIPIFQTGYGRKWREWATLRSENFDALADDQEAHANKLNRNMVDYVIDGDASISFEGYTGYGIKTSPLAKAINLGASGGGANIDLSSPATTSDAIDAFFTQTFGAVLDAQLIEGGVNVYVSPEIYRNFLRSYSGASGFKGGNLLSYLLTNPNIRKIEKTFKMSGNEFIAFVPDANYIRPLVGMAVNTTAVTRMNPTDDYHFLMMGAMGLEIRADINGRSGVFYSTDI